MINAQEALQRHREPEHPWTSPAELAAMPTLGLLPSSGFNYVVLRYPPGHGFTQRLLYPHSNTSAGSFRPQHRHIPPPPTEATPQQASRDSEGHQCLEQERSLQCMQHEVPVWQSVSESDAHSEPTQCMQPSAVDESKSEDICSAGAAVYGCLLYTSPSPRD